MERKRNNSSWVCDRLEELIKEYKEDKKDARYDGGDSYWVYEKIIYDLEQTLYE